MGGSAKCWGGTSGKIELDMEKCPFSPRVKQGIFQFVPKTLKHPTLHLL